MTLIWTDKCETDERSGCNCVETGTIKEKATEFQVKKSRKHPKTLNLIHFMTEKNYITFT